MTYREVRQFMREPTEFPKQLRLRDGTRILVHPKDPWLAAGDYLIVADEDGQTDRHVSYRDIEAVRIIPRRQPSEP